LLASFAAPGRLRALRGLCCLGIGVLCALRAALGAEFAVIFDCKPILSVYFVTRVVKGGCDKRDAPSRNMLGQSAKFVVDQKGKIYFHLLPVFLLQLHGGLSTESGCLTTWCISLTMPLVGPPHLLGSYADNNSVNALIG